AAAVGVVLSSTDTVPTCDANMLATTRSGLPSPLKSPTATERGPLPVVKAFRVAKEDVVAAVGVVLSSTDTVLAPQLVTTRSGLRSQLKSPTAREWGAVPVAKFCWVAKEEVAAPAGVVLSSTDTVSAPRLAIARSSLPSPLKSATATEQGSLLVP